MKSCRSRCLMANAQFLQHNSFAIPA
ncbi:hypothetical protein RSAG8_07330, partial [Rhizoctonia solani AG-8 WAC10335]